MFRKSSQWRTLLPISFGVVLIALTMSKAAAFADSYITSYSLSNISPYDYYYGPSGGQIWASNYLNHPVYGTQYIQAENYNIYWVPANADNVRANWYKLGPVFHVFDAATSNCALPFDYDGTFVASQLDAWVYTKNADCWWPGNGHNNEARVYWFGSEVVGWQYYFGGAEFVLQSGDLYIQNTGKVSNDIYFNGQWAGERKDTITNGTWCFNGSGGKWSC